MVTFLVVLLLPSCWSQLSHRAPSNCVTKSGTDCIFPFTYKETKYFECTFTDSRDAWCATAIDPAGNVVTNKWEDCEVSRCPVEEPECVTVGGPSPESPCVFPFTVGGETHTECLTGRLETGCVTYTYWGFLTVTTCKYEGSDDVPWCSTATTSDGTHVTDGGHWGECSQSCLQCRTTDGPEEGKACVFPFTWQGVTYDQCQPWEYGGQWETDGELWCSTETDDQGTHVEGHFGICSDSCPVDVSVFARTKTSVTKNQEGETVSP